MRCPHCTVNFHSNWSGNPISYHKAQFRVPFMGQKIEASWQYRTAICPNCKDGIIEIAPVTPNEARRLRDWRMVYSIGASRGPISLVVPTEIREDYIEACNVLPISAKASAALSRRCLQNVLNEAGYKVRDLSEQIDLLLNEKDPLKAIPLRLRTTIDLIRNFGNFGAHPINNKTTLQIIDVEPHEAESCLDILDECFEHFYAGPAAAKARKAALDAKLIDAKKPVSK